MMISPLFMVWLGASTISALVLGLAVVMMVYECQLVFSAEQGRKKDLKRPKAEPFHEGLTFVSVIPLQTLQDTFVVLDLLDDLTQQSYPQSRLPIVLGARNHFVASALQLLPIPWERVSLCQYEGEKLHTNPTSPVEQASGEGMGLHEGQAPQLRDDESFLPWLMQSVAKTYTHSLQDASFMACFMPWDRIPDHYFAQAALKALDAPVFQGSVIGKCRLAKGFLQPIEDLMSRIRHRVTLPGLSHAGWSVPLRPSGWCIRMDIMYHIPFEGMMYMAPLGFDMALHLSGYRVAWAPQMQLLDTHAGVALLDKVVHQLNVEAERLGVLCRYGMPLLQRVLMQLKHQVSQWCRFTQPQEGGLGLLSQKPYASLLMRLTQPLLGGGTVLFGGGLLVLDALSHFSAYLSATVNHHWFGYQALLGLVGGMLISVRLLQLVASRGEPQDYLTAFVREPLQWLMGLVLLPWACIRLVQLTWHTKASPEKILPSSSLIRKRLAKRLVQQAPAETLLHEASEVLGVTHSKAPLNDAFAYPHHQHTLQHRRSLSPATPPAPEASASDESTMGYKLRQLPSLPLVFPVEPSEGQTLRDALKNSLGDTQVSSQSEVILLQGQHGLSSPSPSLREAAWWHVPARHVAALTTVEASASDALVQSVEVGVVYAVSLFDVATQTPYEGRLCWELLSEKGYRLTLVYREASTDLEAQGSMRLTSPVLPTQGDALTYLLGVLSQASLALEAPSHPRMQWQHCMGCQQFILQSLDTLKGCCACPSASLWGRATMALRAACPAYLPELGHLPTSPQEETRMNPSFNTATESLV
jgi:hypothetical protein